MRVHVLSNDEIVPGPLTAEVHYVLEKVLDVSYFARDTINDFVEQLYLLALLLAYVGDVDYRGDRLRREVEVKMRDLCNKRPKRIA